MTDRSENLDGLPFRVPDPAEVRGLPDLVDVVDWHKDATVDELDVTASPWKLASVDQRSALELLGRGGELLTAGRPIDVRSLWNLALGNSEASIIGRAQALGLGSNLHVDPHGVPIVVRPEPDFDPDLVPGSGFDLDAIQQAMWNGIGESVSDAFTAYNASGVH